MTNSPVSYKPTGFIRGAGHGGLFEMNGEQWKVATNSISVRHMFERRISMFAAGFDKDGYLYTDTYMGDYPTYLPTYNNKGERPDWSVLSYCKPTKVSSTLNNFNAAMAVDENSHTAWVASTNSSNEWFEIDLEKICDIAAIQVNFDEEGSELKGRDVTSYQSYTIEASQNGKDWYTIVDKSTKKTDTPHDYIEFKKTFEAQYLKIKNVDYTSAPYFSLRDLRVFGSAKGNLPQTVKELTVTRGSDQCVVNLKWNKVDNCDGYIVRYGVAPDKLYNNFQVRNETELTINSLNTGVEYYFEVDTFNENGVSKSSPSMKITTKQ